MIKVQALIGLADVARQSDDMDTAVSLYRAAHQLAVIDGNVFGQVRALLPQGYVLRRGVSAQEALAVFTECEQLARTLGDRMYVANALVGLGETHGLLEHFPQAVEALEEAVQIFTTVDSQVGIAGAALRLTDLYRRAVDHENTERWVHVVIDATQRSGQLQEAVDAHDILTELCVQRGDTRQARRTAARGLVLANSSNYPRGAAHLRMTLGHAERRGGRPEHAERQFRRALDYFHPRKDDLAMVAYCLGDIAGCAEDRDDMARAIDLRLSSVSALEAIRARQSLPRYQHEYRRRFQQVYRWALRTAVAAQHATAFVTVFEGLWGRRLAGLAAGIGVESGGDPALYAQLLARAAANRRAHGEKDELPPDERLPRMLGGIAMSGALPDVDEDVVGQAVAVLYHPFDSAQAERLLTQIPGDVAVCLLAPVPERDLLVAWLVRTPDGRTLLGENELSHETRSLVDRISGNGLGTETLQDVTCLAEILPAPLQDLSVGTRLVMVPLEDLWAMPWAAAPCGKGLLGERFALRFAPSLAVASLVGARVADTTSRSGTRTWIGPGVDAHRLDGLTRSGKEGVVTAVDAKAAFDAVTAATCDTVAVVAHGRPVSGIGHFLELGEDTPLTPVDLFCAQTPRRLALIACWGARAPGESAGDPLTLGTLALARSTQEVAATVCELGDDAAAAGFVDEFLYRGVTCDWAEALRATTAGRLRDPRVRRGPLYRWAPLVILGAW